MVVRVLLLTVAALLLGGCGGKDDEPPVTTATTTTVTTTTPPVLEGASTAPVVWSSSITETALLSGVRVASHEGYDRVVFEFRNGVPGYDVRYVEPPILADGSGEEVPVAGGAALVVRMEPALDADLTQESAPRDVHRADPLLAVDVGGRRARPDRRLRGRSHLGRRRRRETALPRHAAGGPGAHRDRRQLAGRPRRRRRSELLANCALPVPRSLASGGRDPYLHQCTEHGAPEVEGLPGD